MSSSEPTIQQTEGGVTVWSVIISCIDEFKAVGLVLPITATVITLFRLGERIHQRRLWLDDAWAAFALVLNIVFFVVCYLDLSHYAEYPQAENVAMYYVTAQFFCATVWASRTSILFTIVRLTLPSSGLRRTLLFIFAAFLTTYAILFAQVFWVCESEPGWKSDPHPQCDLGESVTIAQIITDVIADTLLIIIPLWMVYGIKLTRPQKIRVTCIFSASAITTVACLTHAYYVFNGSGLQECIAGYFEVSMSLIVANFSVVAGLLFRIGSEENATISKSIVTIGSLPVRQRVYHDSHYLPTTMELGDLGTLPSTGRGDSGGNGDVESHVAAEPGLSLNV